MKRSILVVPRALGFLFLSAVLPSLCAAVPSDILSVKGMVEIQRVSEPGKWVEAKKGMQLQENDTIRTAMNSEARVTVGKTKSHMTLRAQSVMKIATSDKSWICELPAGRIRVFMKKMAKTMEVRTPVATAAVRGTIFEVSYDENARTGSLQVLEGRVALSKGGGGEIFVPKGQKVEF